MKVVFTVNDKLSFELDGGNQKEVFEQLATLQEVFDARVCGKCGGKDLRFVVREHDENQFFEVHCTKKDCRARLAFGSHKTGNTLFPKRKDGDGNWLPDNGWTKWDKEKQERV